MRDLAPPRLPDWPDRLSAFLKDHARAEFLWGQRDCALFGADAVAALTGMDFGAPFRGKYTDAKGAALALREHGAGTITRTFDRHLNRTPLAKAKRGDLAMARGWIGVVIGGEAVFLGEQEGAPGLVRIPRAEWQRAWAV